MIPIIDGDSKGKMADSGNDQVCCITKHYDDEGCFYRQSQQWYNLHKDKRGNPLFYSVDEQVDEVKSDGGV